MYSNNFVKKPDPIFLNVKPVNNNNGTRKQSNHSVATIDSMNKSFIPNIFYRNIAPIKWFLYMIGVLPMTRYGPRRAKFLFKSTAFFYASAFFLCLLMYVAYVAFNRIKIVTSLSGSFAEAVTAYLFLVNILPIFIVPIMWLETPKICRLFNEWDDFEILYNEISGHSVPLNLQRKARNIAIVLPLLSIISVVITHVTMVNFGWIQVIPYCILDNLTTMLGAWWYIMCEALSIMAGILAERFQKALRHRDPAAIFADYRALWLQLSKLTRATGNANCYTFIFLIIYLFFIITISIYGLLSQLSDGFGIKDIGLIITAAWNIGFLYFICEQAHFATFSVCTNFQKKLLMVELNWLNSAAQAEINMFLRVTEMNPSNINFNGYFDVNRNLLKGLLVTMVTYLIVLLQFQISIPTEIHKPTSNITSDSVPSYMT